MSLLHHLLALFGRPEFSLIEAHQASTHLSLGLLLGAAGFDIAALIVPPQRRIWRDTAFWMQVAGFFLLVMTFGLGFYSNPFAGKHNELAQKTEWHKNFAYVALGTFALLFLWRMARTAKWGRMESAAFAFVNAFGLAVITVTGWMGGHIGG